MKILNLIKMFIILSILILIFSKKNFFSKEQKKGMIDEINYFRNTNISSKKHYLNL